MTRNAQIAQLSIMDRIHEICLKHHVTYYMIGGTALGAVRHKGFIPWDVDIDIAMPRADYELFLNKFSNELLPDIRCCNYKNTKGYFPPHATAQLENSKLVLRFDEFNNINRKVYIDIFPLDNVPKSHFIQWYQRKTFRLIRNLKKLKDGKCYPTNSKATIALKKMISIILYPISFNVFNHWLDSTMKLEKRDTGYMCSMASHYSYKKQTFTSDVYGKGKLMLFEDKQYYVPSQIEYYLTRLYGDYMKCPPLDVQEEQMKFIKEVSIW